MRNNTQAQPWSSGVETPGTIQRFLLKMTSDCKLLMYILKFFYLENQTFATIIYREQIVSYRMKSNSKV